jgi:nicotinamide-nucleotide amidase
MKNEKNIMLQQILRKNNYTITCAESCTGGLIASKITEISGSSDIFKGSIVTYSNEVKEKELGVKKETMVQYGAVSIEVVSQMLDGVLKKFDATYAIAVSGVAGPNGGTKDKPVGTVVIGIKNIFDFSEIKTFHFIGNRKEIQLSAMDRAFDMILNKLQNLN